MRTNKNVVEKIDYLVLLRGINVGGNNIIKMNYLKKLFEELGFSDIKTYIQSGNILFKDTEEDKIKLVERIERILFEKLNCKINAMILTFPDMERIISGKPDGFGEENDRFKYDVIFLIDPLTTKEAIQEIKAKEGVDEIYEGEKVVYSKRLIEKITKSYISKIVGTPIYRNITIRNWNTTKRLYELIEAYNSSTLNLHNNSVVSQHSPLRP
ncbi:MAG: DUF1697 domain-containing protein [Tannerellaceae bacterium]|nr:DUF1697 domain-containing protein [Tannerellaceae bacterium]